MTENEIRRDPIEGRLVIIAPGRSARPHGGLLRSEDALHARTACVLCPSRIDAEPCHLMLPGRGDAWRIKVVANKYPAVSRTAPEAYGSHELVVETPDPRKAFEDFSVREIRDVLLVFAARIEALRADRSLRYVTVFKNVGAAAGASLAHAHSQIIATAIVPPAVVGREGRLEAARHRMGECPICAAARTERRTKRFIAAEDGVLALAPYASAFPFEARIAPVAHRASLTEFTDTELLATAALLRKTLRTLRRMKLAYNVVFDELFGAREFHTALKILPRGTVWAGVELANGMVVNPVAPETAASYYRKSFTR